MLPSKSFYIASANLIPSLTVEFPSFIAAYFMNHTFSFVIQHPLFNLHTL